MSSIANQVTARWQGIGLRAAILLLSGLPLLASATAAVAQAGPAALVVSEQRFATHIAEASQRFDVPVAWIRAVLVAESAQDIWRHLIGRCDGTDADHARHLGRVPSNKRRVISARHSEPPRSMEGI